MNFTADKLKQARDAGYSDDEIWGFAAEQDDRFIKAKDAGYSLDEVSGFFSEQTEAEAVSESPVGTSFMEEVRQIPQALQQSIEQPLEAMGETAEVLGAPKVSAALRGLTEAPEGYIPAAQRLIEPQEGEFQIGGIAPQYIPRAAVEQAGQIVGAIATGAIGRTVGKLAGSAAGPKGAIVGAVAGQFLGPALFEMSQIVGPTARGRAKNQGREEPTTDDLAWAWATAAGSGALNAIGAKYLPNGDKLATGFGRRIAESIAAESSTEGIQEIVQQTGESFLTEQGLQLKPKEAIGAALTAGPAAGAATVIAEPFRAREVTPEFKAEAAAETQVAAQSAATIAPATADVVSEQAATVIEEANNEAISIPATVSPRREGETDQEWRARTERERAETPEQRVVRLQEEARAATEIELEEEPEVAVEPPVTVTTPVEPTPEGAVTPVEPVVTPEVAEPQLVAEVAPTEPVVADETYNNLAVQIAESSSPADWKTQAIDALVEDGSTEEDASAQVEDWSNDTTLNFLTQRWKTYWKENPDDFSSEYENYFGTQPPVIEQAAPAVTPPAEVAPEVTQTPETPNLEPLRRVARAEQAPEDVPSLVEAGLVEVYKDQPVLTDVGIAQLPEADRPRLTPEARKIQIDTGATDAAAEAILKGLRIGVDQVPFDVKMPAGWTIEGDIYIPPTPQEVAKAEEPQANRITAFLDAAPSEGLKYFRPATEEALRWEGGIYPTISNESGTVKVALDRTDIFERKSGEVWRGDPTAPPPNTYIIQAVVTSPESRGTGEASAVMQRIINMADKSGLTLKLEPVPMKSFVQRGQKAMTKKQLVDWYKRLGFTQAKEGSDAVLIREPAPAPEVDEGAITFKELINTEDHKKLNDFISKYFGKKGSYLEDLPIGVENWTDKELKAYPITRAYLEFKKLTGLSPKTSPSPAPEVRESRREPQENVVKLPRSFIQDHIERDLPTPQILQETDRFVWMRADDPNMGELLDDARYYSSEEMMSAGGLDPELRKHGRNAKRMLESFEKQSSLNIDSLIKDYNRRQKESLQQDREYLDAVERGDLETAQRIVDEAARAAGYTPNKLYHGSAFEFDQFLKEKLGSITMVPSADEGFFFTTRQRTSEWFRDLARERSWFERHDAKDKELAVKRAESQILWNQSQLEKEKARERPSEDLIKLYENGVEAEKANLAQAQKDFDAAPKVKPTIYEAYLSLKNPLVHDYKGKVKREKSYKELLTKAKEEGRDGVILKNTYDSGERDKIDAFFKGRLKEPEDIYVVFEPNQIKRADPVTRDDQGDIIPPSQRFQPTEEDIRYAKIQMPRPAGMETEAVTTKLESLGFGRGGIVSVVNEPDASFEGRTIIRDGKVVGIELNAAAIKDDAAIERVLNHEIAESANADGALNRLVAGLTPKERKEINDAITRLGYAEKARTAEEAARAVELLAEGWRGRKWFDRAVARIEAWANKLGYKLTRRAAEYIAARNVSEINAEFKQAYNKFINVRGEAREGRAFVTPAENARFLELAQNPEANREELQKMVDAAATRAGFSIKAFHGTTEEFTTFDTSLRNLDTARYGEGLIFFTDNPELAKEYSQLGTLEFRRANAEALQATQDFERITSETFPDVQRIAMERRGLDIANERVANGQITQEQYNAWVKAEERVFDANERLKELQKLPARPKVMPVFLKIDQAVSEDVEGGEFFGSWNFVLPNLVDQMRSQGGNGVIARGVYDSPFGTPLKSTVYAIPSSNQAKSADPVTRDDQGNIIPLSERFQPTEADIRYSIRESRREDAIPTFSEGSPEASTLSTMAASMAKVDAASEAKPNPENKPTYKISEIASVWMDQGGDTRQLQDLITESTNLTPANAKKVANAIAKQYGLQQSIAEARVETAEGISLEGLPEGVSIPKEADPKRPKTVIQRLIDVTTGVRVPPVKITATERSLLNNQIRMRAAANREAKKAQQETANEVVEIIKAMELRGPVRPKQAQALAKRAAKVIWTSEKSMESFMAYAEKVVANTNYDADLREAKATQKRAAELSKRKTIASPQREILANVAKIGVNMLDNPREFAEVVNYYMRGFKPVVSPDYLVVPDDEMTSYLSQAEDIVEEAKIAFDRVVTQRLSEKYGVSPDRIQEILNAQDIDRALVQYAKREVAEAILNEKANEVLAGLRAYDQTGLRNDQRNIIDSILKLDPSLLSSQEKQQFVRTGNNIILNNQTHGAELFAVTAKGQQMAREAASNEDLIAKNKAWVNILPSLRSRTLQKTWRNWALELQSVADTFRNAFGKGAMAKVYRMMGMYELDRGFTAAANTINQIQEEIASFYNSLEKKYKAEARNQDGILAEGIVGFLIQKVPEKGEVESLAQRRNLIQQDIRNRRISQDADRIEMADRIERILQQLDGESVSDIMANLKRDYRANYESVTWLKDTLFPKYKEFLKRFDENFNDQANNYENPDYLPIGFIRAGVSLAITPENEALYYEHVSLRPKQSSYTIKRADYTKLPTDKTTNKPKEIEFNLRRNAFDSLSDQINRAYTNPAWQQIFAFMKTPESEKLFGGAANKEFFIERLNRLRLSRMRRGSMSSGYIEKTADVLSVFARKIGTGIALGGAYQPFKQAPDQIIAAIGTTGRADLMAENMAPSALKAAKVLLDKFSIGRRGDASSGYKYINQMEGAQNKIERYLSESRWDAAKEQAGKISDVWLLALKKTDYVFAAGAWMTYYRAQLAKDKVAFQGWEKEAELLETDTARQDAASYAEQMTDIYQGSSDPTKMATFVQSGKSGWENLFKAVFVPFNSFAVQQRMRIYSDARDSFTKSGEDAATGRFGLAATIGGLVAFHSVRRFALPALTGLGVSMLYAAFGVDMDEPDEEKKAEDFAKRWRQFLGEFTANLLVGGSGQIVEAATIDSFNYAAYLIAVQTEHETVLGDDGEIIPFSRYAKERSPFWRYRSFDNAISLGMFDIGLDQGKKAILETKTLMTPEEMENFTNEEQSLLYFAALSDWLYLMRLNDADFARMVDRARREVKAKSKETEKELARIRAGR